MQPTAKSTAVTTVDEKRNSEKCEFQDRGNCREAYIGLNRNYNAIKKQVS